MLNYQPPRYVLKNTCVWTQLALTAARASNVIIPRFLDHYMTNICTIAYYRIFNADATGDTHLLDENRFQWFTAPRDALSRGAE